MKLKTRLHDVFHPVIKFHIMGGIHARYNLMITNQPLAKQAIDLRAHSWAR